MRLHCGIMISGKKAKNGFKRIYLNSEMAGKLGLGALKISFFLIFVYKSFLVKNIVSEF